MVYADELLYSWESGIWGHTERSWSDQPPVKTPGTESLWESLVGSSFTHVVTPIVGGIKCIKCDSIGRVLAACTWFPPDFAPNTFPFADFVLCIINHSSEYDYMLSSVSPHCKSLNLRMALGTVSTYEFKH